MFENKNYYTPDRNKYEKGYMMKILRDVRCLWLATVLTAWGMESRGKEKKRLCNFEHAKIYVHEFKQTKTN